MAKTQTTEANAAAFTKAQLVASQRYAFATLTLAFHVLPSA